eukprot:6197535-Pleurochrysis_carterae.AAC.3
MAEVHITLISLKDGDFEHVLLLDSYYVTLCLFALYRLDVVPRNAVFTFEYRKVVKQRMRDSAALRSA